MAWNAGSNKDAPRGKSKAATSPVPIGAPVASNPALTTRGYRDGWDINRAYRDGVARVVWLMRGIEAIAGNQARLPMVLRKERNHESEIVKSNPGLLEILNSQSNPGENSFVFRKRLSQQLIMSSRGVFIEVLRKRSGAPLALQLLPPEFTAPIPDPKKFVSGFEVWLPTGQKDIIKPENVIWIRNPHPLDPYLSLTPLEAAGLAIESETLAKLYNRNFLINDGRPGGLIVVQGDMDDDDKEELRNRFRGNLWRAGSVSVIASDGGAQYIDTAANPRDAAYGEMRNISKEEILAALGVPEVILGNAQGNTFANAAEELRVFWMETMLPHLEMIGRGFDVLDDKNYIDFDVSEVPILVLSKQEREKYLLEEMQSAGISANEYRLGTGRKEVDSELADALLANPNLTPIGNTKKKTPPPPGPNEIPPQVPPTPGAPPGAPAAPAAEQAAPPEGGAPTEQAGGGGGEAPVQGKSLDGEVETKAEQAIGRWEQILGNALDRFFERQQRVVMEKARGAKSQRALADGTLTAEQLFDPSVWDKQLGEDVRPVLMGAAREAAGMVSDKAAQDSNTSDGLNETIDAQTTRIQKMNTTTADSIAAAVLAAQAVPSSERSSMLAAGLGAVFADAVGARAKRASEIESAAATSAGIYHASVESGVPVKVWHTRRDARVREAHKKLEAKKVPVESAFKVDGAELRFPGDPLAPPELAIGCRCWLGFNRSST